MMMMMMMMWTWRNPFAAYQRRKNLISNLIPFPPLYFMYEAPWCHANTALFYDPQFLNDTVNQRALDDEIDI